MFGLRIIRWLPVDKETDSNEVIMKFLDGNIQPGWKSFDGWHYSNVWDFPCDPQPTHFAEFPKK